MYRHHVGALLEVSALTETRSSPPVFYDNIAHILQNTKLTVQLINGSGSLQKFHHGKIRLLVDFENNNEYVIL